MFVITQPEMLAAAAGNFESIGAVMAVNNSAAAGPTTTVVPAGSDEVSAVTATLFATHAAMYQAISAQAVAIHQQFVAALAASATCYAATEAANAAAVG
jgi:hypothetical protein